MATTCNFTINKIWGYAIHTTSKLHCHPKLLNPTETYLFYLLPKDILTDIDIWVSGLKHRDKFKSVIINMATMCNPIFLAILQEIWVLYHNFSVYNGFYNDCSYAWACRRVKITRARAINYLVVIIQLLEH